MAALTGDVVAHSSRGGEYARTERVERAAQARKLLIMVEVV